MADFDAEQLRFVSESEVDDIICTKYIYEESVVIYTHCIWHFEDYQDFEDYQAISGSAKRDMAVVIRNNESVETRDPDDPIDCMLTIQSFGKYPLSYKVMREMAEFFEIGKYIDISKIGDIVCIEPLVFDRREFDDRDDGHRRHDGHRDDDEHRDVDVWTDVDRRHKEPERRYIAGQQNRDHPRFFI